MLKLIFVRHGQTEANANRRLQGISDGPLTEEGQRQIEKLALQLKDIRIDSIVSSDLIRAKDTAAAIAKFHAVDVQVNPLVREWNCGDLDGKPAEVFLDLIQRPDVDLATFRPGGGENLIEVKLRASEFLNQIMASFPGTDKTMVVCSHGDFIRMAIGIILDMQIEDAEAIQLGNASYSTFEFDGSQWKEVALNQMP
jgi:broad specificity phosphatase PhoE